MNQNAIIMNKNLKKYKDKQTSKLIYNYSTYEIATILEFCLLNIKINWLNKLIKYRWIIYQA